MKILILIILGVGLVTSQRINGTKYAKKALDYLSNNYPLDQLGYDYYRGKSGWMEEGFDKKLYIVMNFISDFQDKNKEFINSLVANAYPLEDYDYNYDDYDYDYCDYYCDYLAPYLNPFLHWQYVIGIKFQARELKQQLGNIDEVDSKIMERFEEILYDYGKNIYRGGILYKNCRNFLCPI